MWPKAAKQGLVWGGVLILVGALLLVNQFVELSPWLSAACLAGAGLGAFGLYWTDRSDGLVLLAAYVLWAIAGLLALVPSGILRDEAAAFYVLLAIALPFVAVFIRDRAQWWALIPPYVLLAILGVIVLGESGVVGDNWITAYVLLVIAIPFFVVYARDRRQWWALIPGGILAGLALSLDTWLSWPSIRSSLIAAQVVEVASALALLVAGAWILVRGIVRKGSSQ